MRSLLTLSVLCLSVLTVSVHAGKDKPCCKKKADSSEVRPCCKKGDSAQARPDCKKPDCAKDSLKAHKGEHPKCEKHEGKHEGKHDSAWGQSKVGGDSALGGARPMCEKDSHQH